MRARLLTAKQEQRQKPPRVHFSQTRERFCCGCWCCIGLCVGVVLAFRAPCVSVCGSRAASECVFISAWGGARSSIFFFFWFRIAPRVTAHLGHLASSCCGGNCAVVDWWWSPGGDAGLCAPCWLGDWMDGCSCCCSARRLVKVTLAAPEFGWMDGSVRYHGTGTGISAVFIFSLFSARCSSTGYRRASSHFWFATIV